MAREYKTDDEVRDEDVKNHDEGRGHSVAGAIGAALGAGAGAAAIGATQGAAIGTTIGPVGTVAGAVVGGVAGALAGKAVADHVDPEAEDAYWSDEYKNRPYVDKKLAYKDYAPAYRYGMEAEGKYEGAPYSDVENNLERDWNNYSTEQSSGLGWNKAKDAVRDAYDRTIQLREERLRADKERVQAGEVRLRKEIVTETKSIDVPVEKEELVIERRPASGKSTSQAGKLSTDELRIPLSEERVNVSKEKGVREEVSLRREKVRDTERVSDTLQHEELKVEKTGNARVKENKA
jgi:uncharacterized protein (TIGR02271 family)